MGCGCLLALATLLSPRLALFLIQIFSTRLSEVFSSFWIGLLGFLFLPWTALAWVVAYQPFPSIGQPAGVSGIGYLVVAVGLLLDISSYTNSERTRRQRADATT